MQQTRNKKESEKQKMTKYTNSGLVTHCKKALKLKTAYMWGGLFREITDNYIKQLSEMYPQQYGTNRQNTLKAIADKGYYGCDCIGLIKSYYFGGIGIAANAKGYDGSKDYGVGGMFEAAKSKGKINAMPKNDGILLMTADLSHAGVYIGDGQVIECTLSSLGDGVVQTNFSDRCWNFWCQCPFLEDDTSNLQKPVVVPEAVELHKGNEIILKNTPLYVSATAIKKSNVISGKYWVHSDGIINGRIRITTYNGCKDCTGWVDADRLKIIDNAAENDDNSQ